MKELSQETEAALRSCIEAGFECVYLPFQHLDMPGLMPQQQLYLNHLMCCGDNAVAAYLTGVSPMMSIIWAEDSYEFRMWEIRVNAMLGVLTSDKIRYMGTHGSTEPIVSKDGEVKGFRRKRSPELAFAYVKAFDQRWRPIAEGQGLITAYGSPTPAIAANTPPTPAGFLPDNNR